MKYDKEYEFAEGIFVTYHCLNSIFDDYKETYPQHIIDTIDSLLNSLRECLEPNDEYKETDITDFRYVMQVLYDKEQIRKHK